jgi:hypothetical protein
MYTPRTEMVKERRMAIAGAGFVLIIATGIYFGDNIAATIIGLSFLYAVWFLLFILLSGRSRWIGGIILVLFSGLLFGIGFIAAWVGIFGVLVFLQGSWLALSGAARVRA